MQLIGYFISYSGLILINRRHRKVERTLNFGLVFTVAKASDKTNKNIGVKK